MKSAISLFIFIIFSAFCQAQQSIMLTSNVTNIGVSNAKIFKLPVNVLCKFKDNTTKILVLERVNGDTLFFDTLFSKTNQYSQLYSELNYIQFLENGYHSKHAFSILTTFTAVFSTAIVIYATSMKNSGNDELRFASSIMLPIAIISTSLSILAIANLPPKYVINKYSLFVK